MLALEASCNIVRAIFNSFPLLRILFSARSRCEQHRARQHQLVLEYDGFEYHFAKGIPSATINSATWQCYLTEDDLEREKVLESFGYPMIRLNRLTSGRSGRHDSMLPERLGSMLNGNEPRWQGRDRHSEYGCAIRSGDSRTLIGWCPGYFRPSSRPNRRCPRYRPPLRSPAG